MFYVVKCHPVKAVVVAVHREFDDAVIACRFAEETADDGYAAYITENGVIVGDADGRHERDRSIPYDAGGCVMTGREW